MNSEDGPVWFQNDVTTIAKPMPGPPEEEKVWRFGIAGQELEPNSE